MNNTFLFIKIIAKVGVTAFVGGFMACIGRSTAKKLENVHNNKSWNKQTEKAKKDAKNKQLLADSLSVLERLAEATCDSDASIEEDKEFVS